ncbi:hypothetical protein PAPYR_2050 [Paratrimastix pyriformis]|uniref:Uncharacterized protein n=1 Tax=Paratrimastix pyriformis TaxID=342808 RepID=A0ABQ8UQQ2_9EUKA|nr:hypothetical protein PAPYR_2050 [Paratrimastix pyriformis]
MSLSLSLSNKGHGSILRAPIFRGIDIIQLAELSLTDNHLRSIDLHFVFANLTVLYLDRNELDEWSPALCGIFPCLESLSLASNRLKSVRFFSGLRRIRHLILSHNRITTLEGLLPNTSTNRAGAAPFQNLEVLLVDGNKIPTFGALGTITSLPALRKIDYRGNSIPMRESVRFVLQACPSLVVVNGVPLARSRPTHALRLGPPPPEPGRPPDTALLRPSALPHPLPPPAVSSPASHTPVGAAAAAPYRPAAYFSSPPSPPTTMTSLTSFADTTGLPLLLADEEVALPEPRILVGLDDLAPAGATGGWGAAGGPQWVLASPKPAAVSPARPAPAPAPLGARHHPQAPPAHARPISAPATTGAKGRPALQAPPRDEEAWPPPPPPAAAPWDVALSSSPPPPPAGSSPPPEREHRLRRFLRQEEGLAPPLATPVAVRPEPLLRNAAAIRSPEQRPGQGQGQGQGPEDDGGEDAEQDSRATSPTTLSTRTATPLPSPSPPPPSVTVTASPPPGSSPPKRPSAAPRSFVPPISSPLSLSCPADRTPPPSPSDLTAARAAALPEPEDPFALPAAGPLIGRSPRRAHSRSLSSPPACRSPPGEQPGPSCSPPPTGGPARRSPRSGSPSSPPPPPPAARSPAEPSPNRCPPLAPPLPVAATRGRSPSAPGSLPFRPGPARPSDWAADGSTTPAAEEPPLSPPVRVHSPPGPPESPPPLLGHPTPPEGGPGPGAAPSPSSAAPSSSLSLSQSLTPSPPSARALHAAVPTSPLLPPMPLPPPAASSPGPQEPSPPRPQPAQAAPAVAAALFPAATPPAPAPLPAAPRLAARPPAYAHLPLELPPPGTLSTEELEAAIARELQALSLLAEEVDAQDYSTSRLSPLMGVASLPPLSSAPQAARTARAVEAAPPTSPQLPPISAATSTPPRPPQGVMMAGPGGLLPPVRTSPMGGVSSPPPHSTRSPILAPTVSIPPSTPPVDPMPQPRDVLAAEPGAGAEAQGVRHQAGLIPAVAPPPGGSLVTGVQALDALSLSPTNLRALLPLLLARLSPGPTTRPNGPVADALGDVTPTVAARQLFPHTSTSTPRLPSDGQPPTPEEDEEEIVV